MYTMDCPHCARPLYWIRENKDILCRRREREILVTYINQYKCTFCPIEVEVRHRMPPEVMDLDMDTGDEWDRGYDSV